MNPLSTKFVYELTESEMKAYIDQMREQDVIEREEYIAHAVDHIVMKWSAERENPTRSINMIGRVGGRWSFELPVAMREPLGPTGWIGELATVPSNAPIVLTSFKEVHVKAYPWMDEAEVRYVAREQIVEQTEWDS